MPDLSCTVVSCVYNKTQRCSKEDIQVVGNNAKVTTETSCGSFRPQNGSSMSNKVGEPKSQTPVACEATECVHNEKCICHADSIGITGGNACDCKETECSTFKCR